VHSDQEDHVDELSTEHEGEAASGIVGPDFVVPQPGADWHEYPVRDEAENAHGSRDDTATEGAEEFTPATVGAAAYLGAGAEPPPPPSSEPWPEPVTEPVPVAARPAEPARTGPSWVVGLLIASIIGGLIGAGLVAVLDRGGDSGGKVTSAFSSNSSRIAKPQDIQGILAKVQPGVVSIKTQLFQQGFFGDAIPASGAGTGMIIGSDGDVLTNAHVVKGATSIKVTLFNEKDPRDADLVGSDPVADVAVVRIRNAHGLPTVKFGSSADLRVGDDVLAIGNALALPGGPSVTEGIVSAKDRSIGAEDEQLEGLIQTDAAINPGNSGGPLVNASGEVVGMNTAVIQSTGQELAQNIGFAIAIDNIKPLVQRLQKGGGGIQASQAFLGVSSQTMNAQVKERYGFSVDKGAIVVEVTPGSPAENGGVEVGDVITKFGDQAITSNDELVAAVRAHKPGDKVQVAFVRGKDSHTVTVTLGSRPGSAANGSGGNGLGGG
jgi:S1-C subfamily serine protease